MLLLTWKTTFRFRQNLEAFTVIESNNYFRIFGKMGFTIDDKALTTNN
jgi:hypothetical protein